MDDTEFGNKVKVIRVKKGLSAGALARESKISAMHLGRIERGEISPTLSMMKKVVAGLGAELTIRIKKRGKRR